MRLKRKMKGEMSMSMLMTKIDEGVDLYAVVEEWVCGQKDKVLN